MPPQKFQLANIGGTFSSLHEGHRALIRTAFGLAERVQIVVNDTQFAQSSRSYPVPELPWRLRELDCYLRERGWEARARVLVCPREVREFGAWLEPDLDCVIVSDRLKYHAAHFDALRVTLGLPRFTVQILPRLHDDAGEVISSTNRFMAQAKALRG